MDIYEWLKFGAQLLVSFVAIGISILSLRQIRIHSSAKPFIQPLGDSLNRDTGRIVIADNEFWSICLENVGKGIAVKVCVNAVVLSAGHKKITMNGPNVLLPCQKGEYIIADKSYSILCPPTEPIRFIVDILCVSESGYKRRIVWDGSKESVHLPAKFKLRSTD